MSQNDDGNDEDSDSDTSSMSSDSTENPVYFIDLSKTFPTDPALFKVEDIHSNVDLRKELCRLRPCQPNEDDLENGFPTTGETALTKRCFHHSWYFKSQAKNDACSNLEKSKNKFKRDWLVYSPRLDRMFCFWCTLFVPEGTHLSETNWTKIGVNNWKKGLQKIREHEKTDIHKNAAFQYSCFISGNDIQHSISESAKLAEKERREKVDKNRNVISSLCKVTTFLARQNLAFRGHDESENSSNKGNYLELIQLISVFDSNIASYLKENKRYSRYTSPAIQNEIISILAQVMRDEIISEIKEAGIFSMMLDEMSDVSKDEQLSFVFRYALWGEIFESFLTFKNVASTTGEVLFDTVDMTLKEFKLQLSNLRGLGTDGAANMRGKYQGLKTRISQANPIVKSVHCACHALNLVLVQACQCSIPVKVFFATLEELYVFIEGSPKRHHRFFEIQKDLNLTPRSLKRHAETRWETRHKVIEDTLATYPAVIRMLED